MFNTSVFVHGCLVNVWHYPAGSVCLEGSHSVWRCVDRGKGVEAVVLAGG